MPKKTGAHNTKKTSPGTKPDSPRHADGKEYRKGKGSWNQVSGKSLASGGKTKNGCFPKLFLLLLPFLAAGSFLLFR